ncbi:nuclear pore complex protein NUP85 [Nymphaea colorata]|nr:nuclear pore complex protein NUP85 [Nymphaea colorata]
MPGRASDSSTALISFVPEVKDPVVYHLHHGLKSPPSSISVSWSRGNVLRVAFFRHHATPRSGSDAERTVDEGSSGKVVELRFCSGDWEFDEARRRRVAYGSVHAFALLQSQRSVLSTSMMAPHRADWWKHVMEFSKCISELLGGARHSSLSIIENPRMLVKSSDEPTYSKAAWQLLEMFYVDNHSFNWLPERFVDWLADYDRLISKTEMTIHSRLVALQNKLVNLQFVEDDPEYWEGIASALTVGWLEMVVKLLRLHGSYQLDQLDNRETENGLVEAVAVLVSTMPRLRPDALSGGFGQCLSTKPDFIKAWEKWRGQVAKLDCSGFWLRCEHRQTTDGLKRLLQILLGNVESLAAAACHWMELFIAHILYIRPLTMGLEAMYSLTQKCIQLKPTSHDNNLMRLILGILGDNTEVVLAECLRSFGPWMVAHAMELLTAKNHQIELLLHEERYNLGGISIEELHRLVYAQVLASHALTWQIAPIYLASCPKQGLGLLEILLYRQPVQHNQLFLKTLEICNLYELGNIGASIMTIAGIHHWKHGRKGLGVFWLQQAHDEVRLGKIAQQLFESVGKSLSDDSFRQWEGLVELLEHENRSAGGLEFLHMYREFKRSLQKLQNELHAGIQDEILLDAARQALELLILLLKNPSTPQRFWLPLLHDSLILLRWRDHSLLSVSQANLLLRKLQELSLAKLHPGFSEADLPPEALSNVRLALATSLGRAMLRG